jgi:hypothetical protein
LYLAVHRDAGRAHPVIATHWHGSVDRHSLNIDLATWAPPSSLARALAELLADRARDPAHFAEKHGITVPEAIYYLDGNGGDADR